MNNKNEIFSSDKGVQFLGNYELSEQKNNTFIIYCSQETNHKYAKDFEIFYQTVLELPIIVGGGWHSELEKKVFKFWKESGKCSLVYCCAKSLQHSSLYFSNIFNEVSPEKYLIINPNIKSNRISNNTVKTRDKYLLNNFSNFIFVHINPGGRCEKLMEEAENLKKNIFIYNHISNESYFNDYITLIDPFTIDILKCV